MLNKVKTCWYLRDINYAEIHLIPGHTLDIENQTSEHRWKHL